MTEYSVPASSIVGMFFSLVLSVGVPITLLVLLKKKLGARIASFLIGCAVFVVFALLLEPLLHMFVLSSFPAIQQNVGLYAIYGGVAAAVFEETGRLVAMKTVLRKRLDKENALMYGAGHGGIEAIVIGGASAISNLAAAFSINSGKIASAIEAGGETTAASVSQICTCPSALFFMTGVERLTAIVLHIVLSYIVYRAVKDKKPKYFMLALGIHFVVDAGTVWLSGIVSIVWVELMLIIAAVIFAIIVYGAYGRETMAEQQ